MFVDTTFQIVFLRGWELNKVLQNHVFLPIFEQYAENMQTV